MLSNIHLHLVCFSSGSARLNTSQFQKINFLKIFAVYSFAPSMPTKNEPPTSGLWVTLKVAHNPEVGGSNPSPATIKTLKPSRFQGFFFAYRTHFCTHFGTWNRIAATENTEVSHVLRHHVKCLPGSSMPKPIWRSTSRKQISLLPARRLLYAAFSTITSSIWTFK